MQIEKTPSLINNSICFRDCDGFFIYSLHQKQTCWMKDCKPASILALKEKGFFLPIDSAGVGESAHIVSNLMLLLGKGCPMACRYCYANGGTSEELMSLETADKAIAAYLALKPIYPRVSLFGGGEPTVNEKVIRAIIEKYRDSVVWVLTTSGVVKNEFLKWLIEHKVRIAFSIDGPPKVQNYLRPMKNDKTSSEIVEKSIKLWTETSGQNLDVRTTLTEATAKEMESILEYFTKIGVQHLHLEALFNIGRAANKTPRLRRPSLKNLIKATVSALNWAQKNNKGVQVGILTYFLKPGISCYCGPLSGKTLVVNQRGQLTGCSEIIDEENPLWGKVYLGELSDSGFNIQRKKLRELSRRTCSTMQACKNCFMRYNCRGGCANKGISETGSLFIPDPYHCEFARVMAPILIKRMVFGKYTLEKGGD